MDPIPAPRQIQPHMVPLQLLIMATGNYNWFNLHTCVLLLPAWAADAHPRPDAIGDASKARAPSLWLIRCIIVFSFLEPR